jgi:hypothetical protein
MARALEPYRDRSLPDQFQRWIEILRGRIKTIPCFTYIDGSPEGIIAGQQGDLVYDRVGLVYYQKTTDGGNTGWILLGAATQLAIKAGDESVTNSAALQDDDDLTFELDANGVYALEFGLTYFSNSFTPDFKMAWSEPDGTYYWSGTEQELAGGPSLVSGDQLSTGAIGTISGGTSAYMQGSGTILVGGAGGTFVLQWAQNTANGTATDLRAGTWARVTKQN